MSRAFGGGTYLNSAPAAIYNSLTAMTICAWVKPTSPLAAFQIIAIKDPLVTGATEFYVENITPNFANAFGAINVGSTSAESDSVENVIVGGSWVHLAFSFSYTVGGKEKIYKNGVEPTYNTNGSASATHGSTPQNDSTGGWYIGSDTFGDDFVGEIADVRIYNTVLTQPQIASIVTGSNPALANLVAWWKLCSANPFIDSSGNGNSLTNHGTTAGTTSPTFDVCASVSVPYSVPDCRVAPFGPNGSRTVQSTKIYDVQTSSNSGIPPQDDRVQVPVDCRTSAIIPQNSRTPGTFGPGE